MEDETGSTYCELVFIQSRMVDDDTDRRQHNTGRDEDAIDNMAMQCMRVRAEDGDCAPPPSVRVPSIASPLALRPVAWCSLREVPQRSPYRRAACSAPRIAVALVAASSRDCGCPLRLPYQKVQRVQRCPPRMGSSRGGSCHSGRLGAHPPPPGRAACRLSSGTQSSPPVRWIEPLLPHQSSRTAATKG